MNKITHKGVWIFFNDKRQRRLFLNQADAFFYLEFKL